METIKDALREMVLPELASLKASGERVESRLTVVEKGLSGVEKRLDDVNLHLVDQSRRIDETNGRIDAVRKELGGRIDAVREELGGRIDELARKDDEINKRLDRLYEVIVRRDEQVVLVEKVERLESEVSEIQRKLAA